MRRRSLTEMCIRDRDYPAYKGGMPLKEIKLKPETSRPKVLESAARAPKTAMRETWLKSKEKTVSELKETPFAGQNEESSNTPADSAANQTVSGMKTAAQKGADLEPAHLTHFCHVIFSRTKFFHRIVQSN